MKKLLLAAVIFTIIISSGILTIKSYSRASREISDKIWVASGYITFDNWDEAKKEIDNIEKLWAKTERKWEMLIDHLEIDNIEMSLKKTKKYIETKDKTLSLAELESLDFMVNHIYKKESFRLSNIF